MQGGSMSGLKVNLSTNGIHIYESKHSDGDMVKEHHHQIHQFIYTLDGEGKIRLDGKSFELKKDRGALIVPYSNHSIVSDTKLTVLVLAFDQTFLDVAVQNELLRIFFDKSKLIGHHSFGESEIKQLLRKMLFEQSLDQAINRVAMNIYLSELLLVLARSQKSATVSDLNSLRAEKLRNYIDEHYFEIVDSSDISSKLGVSIRHINNIFKEQYNMTPMHYLTKVRMELAQKLLVQTDQDIASICFEIGFETLSSFYRTFKNYTQTSPNTYRKIHKQEIEMK
jgi:AraC-like DNA-binding protein